MNILLVRPRPDPRTINLQSFMICEPLELEYLAAFLEPFGHRVHILDMILEKEPLRRFLEELRPDLVGFTGYLPHINVIKGLAAEVKSFSQEIITVVGGVHAEVRPEDFQDKTIDHVTGKNGMEQLKSIAARGPLPETLASSGEVLPETLASFNFPFPDREKTARYRKNYNYIFHERCATLKTSFGCPFSCQFCFCARITDGRYFCRDLNSVMEELAQIEEKNIFIVDDNFLFNKQRVEDFCHELRKRGIKKSFILFGRTDFIADNPGTMKLLKSVGLSAVFIGLESFKQNELENFNKHTTVEINLRAVRVLEDTNILTYCGIMVGQDWDRADFDGLITYLNGLKYPLVNIQPVTPIPGTPFHESVRSDLTVGLDRCEIWDMAHVLLKPTKMTEKEYYRNILRVYQKTSLRPRVPVMVWRRFGLKACLRAAKGAFSIYRQYRELIRKGCVFQ
ncbi:MAG: B12-binding domain-containing radical SAM protein [Peptococcaceae bacterium]|nr:B12-binding domain-containing radical SAM protein [Peptococcaceae bacterium]